MARERYMSVQDRKDHLRTALPITTAVGRIQPVDGPHRFLEYRLSLERLLLVSRQRSAQPSLRLEPLCFQIVLLPLPLLFETTQTDAQIIQDAFHRRALFRRVAVDVETGVNRIGKCCDGSPDAFTHHAFAVREVGAFRNVPSGNTFQPHCQQGNLLHYRYEDQCSFSENYLYQNFPPPNRHHLGSGSLAGW